MIPFFLRDRSPCRSQAGRHRSGRRPGQRGAAMASCRMRPTPRRRPDALETWGPVRPFPHAHIPYRAHPVISG